MHLRKERLSTQADVRMHRDALLRLRQVTLCFLYFFFFLHNFYYSFLCSILESLTRFTHAQGSPSHGPPKRPRENYFGFLISLSRKNVLPLRTRLADNLADEFDGIRCPKTEIQGRTPRRCVPTRWNWNFHATR